MYLLTLKATNFVSCTIESSRYSAMPPPSGFSFTQRADGTVVIFYRRAVATTLRGNRAAKFLAEVDAGDEQLVMARWTGNFKRGNERTIRSKRQR